MKRAVVLQHVPAEGPGRLGPVLARSGRRVEVYRLDRGEAVPEALDAGDVLVVMGGPMGVADLDDGSYPFLRAEVELLRRRLAADEPTLGICLGSQLLAHAAGARVYPACAPAQHPGAPAKRVYEVGWAPVDFHLGTGDPVLAGLDARETMLHWHGDTFDLPRGAVLLASTPACPQQAFRLGRSFGVQFHCEVDGDVIAAFLDADGAYVEQANGRDGAQRVRDDTARHLERFLVVGERLMDNLVAAMTR